MTLVIVKAELDVKEFSKTAGHVALQDRFDALRIAMQDVVLSEAQGCDPLRRRHRLRRLRNSNDLQFGPSDPDPSEGSTTSTFDPFFLLLAETILSLNDLTVSSTETEFVTTSSATGTKESGALSGDMGSIETTTMPSVGQLALGRRSPRALKNSSSVGGTTPMAAHRETNPS